MGGMIGIGMRVLVVVVAAAVVGGTLLHTVLARVGGIRLLGLRVLEGEWIEIGRGCPLRVVYLAVVRWPICID
jgi:hypothetical protein